MLRNLLLAMAKSKKKKKWYLLIHSVIAAVHGRDLNGEHIDMCPHFISPLLLITASYLFCYYNFGIKQKPVHIQNVASIWICDMENDINELNYTHITSVNCVRIHLYFLSSICFTAQLRLCAFNSILLNRIIRNYWNNWYHWMRTVTNLHITMLLFGIGVEWWPCA